MQHHTRFLYPVAFGITTRPKSVLDRVSYTSTTSMFRHYRNINPSLLYLFRVIFIEAGIAPGTSFSITLRCNSMF